MKTDKVFPAKSVKEILEINLRGEREAVDYYSKILEKLKAESPVLKYEYLKLEHDLRHVIMDEQEHISELKRLLGEK